MSLYATANTQPQLWNVFHHNDKVVLLGGGGAYWAMGEHHAHVEYYDKTGHLGSLPDMLQPR